MVALSLQGSRANTEVARSARQALARGIYPARALAEASLVDLGMSHRVAAARLDGQRPRAKALLSGASNAHCQVVPVSDARYPAWLFEIPDPPIVLWVRGDLAALATDRAVAVVGSRNASPSARATASQLARDLALIGVTVVSGLARGVDGSAHRGALDGRGPTIAVLGHGVDLVYPPEHKSLAEQVAATGAVVSEFPPGTPPYPGNFPMRNRIISGLSRAVVVVEASERSGSLITARMALEQGRDVLAVPGNVLSGCYKGCHALIKDGARLVETVGDILEELGWGPRLAPPVVVGCKPNGNNDLLGRLALGILVSVDDLVATSGRPAAEILAELSELEVAGLVRREAGGGFQRVDGPVTTEKRGRELS